jgi:hypothetical protein
MGWTTAELLADCRFLARRPTLDNEMDPTDWYRLLTIAQRHYYNLFGAHFPGLLYGAPVKLTTSDDGETYDFVDAQSNAITPIGAVEIRASRNGHLLTPGPEFDAATDFVIEGTKIRIPNGKTRTFADGPYARYIAPPSDIAENVEPSLVPDFARDVLPPRACAIWATRGGSRDPTPYMAEEQKRWSGDPLTPGDFGLMGALKKQYFASMIASPGVIYWWRSPDLG